MRASQQPGYIHTYIHTYVSLIRVPFCLFTTHLRLLVTSRHGYFIFSGMIAIFLRIDVRMYLRVYSDKQNSTHTWIFNINNILSRVCMRRMKYIYIYIYKGLQDVSAFQQKFYNLVIVAIPPDINCSRAASFAVQLI